MGSRLPWRQYTNLFIFRLVTSSVFGVISTLTLLLHFDGQDYLVFMPEEYYGGTILEAQRLDPCLVNGPKDVVCDRYTYPDIVDDNAVKHEAENGYFSKKAWQNDQKLTLKYYSNSNVLKQLGTERMVVMNKEQVGVYMVCNYFTIFSWCVFLCDVLSVFSAMFQVQQTLFTNASLCSIESICVGYEHS